MNPLPTTQSIMTPIIVSAAFDAPLWEARKMLESKGIRHLPVLQDDRLVGMLSDRDIKAASILEKQDVDITVGDVCCVDVFHVRETTPLSEVALAMAEKRVGASVVTRDGTPIGMITTTDICKAFGELLKAVAD